MLVSYSNAPDPNDTGTDLAALHAMDNEYAYLGEDVGEDTVYEAIRY